MPRIRITAGCHPHNAKLFDAAAKRQLYSLLGDARVSALGEIGLDYHYDLSPRDVQQQVFREQIAMAKDMELPIALHIREAHDDALRILNEEGFPPAGTILHCCSLGPEQLRPWIEAGCYIAYGGAITFNNCEEAREGAKLVPRDRLLTETDGPYMAPVPLRGTTCTPDMVAFTVCKLAEVLGIESAGDKVAFADLLVGNALAVLNRRPTRWQSRN